MNNICGYVVLRKPMHNFYGADRSAFFKKPPCIGDIYYSGIDRMAWFDLDEDHYSGILPCEFIELRDEIEEKNQDFTDIKLLGDLDKTKRILEFCNRHQDRNEICVVFSENLAKQKKVVIGCSNVMWLGNDVYCHGYGSILAQGLFAKPDLFPEFIGQLNTNGLFNLDSYITNKYIERYIEMSKLHNLEQIDDVIDQIDIIAVGRLISPL